MKQSYLDYAMSVIVGRALPGPVRHERTRQRLEQALQEIRTHRR
jgi:hypothetical protein